MPPSIPIATYRLQLTPQFGFDDAAALVPYLKMLGISHLYASPFLKARAGTTHGYDIIDHTALNPQFGGDSAFRRMSDALLQADIGLILDFVPNHMAVHYADNAWWLDVLEWGPRSPYAKFFDIDWDNAIGPPRLLLPVLARSYGGVLEAGEIDLRYDATEGSFSAWYYGHRMPIGPDRYSEILQKAVATANAGDAPAGRQLLALAARHRGPGNPSRDQASALKREIASVSEGADIIKRGLSAYQPASGQAGAVAALHHLINRQHYRPAHWRLAQSEINYRRFFDINELAGLRIEDPDVFRATHSLVLRLIAEGRLQGLRLDHIDGVREPHQYLRRLQREIQGERRTAGLYILVEKILGEGEALRPWPGVAGTTGYEWLNVISRVLLDGRGLEALDRIWREASGVTCSFDAILRQSKQHVLTTILASEFKVLARLLVRIAFGQYSTRDYTGEHLRQALELFVLNFPVYRTYLTATGPSPADRAIIDAAIDASRNEWIDSDHGIFDFLRDALTLDLAAPGRARHSITRVRRFALKVQQFTGPLMAKSLEDTAFYRHHRLLALNEVGGNPASTALSVAGFHQCMAERAATAPHGLTATATHDTKRGEDARTRLIALAELADEWEGLVRHLRKVNGRWIDELPEPRPSPAHEYMIYQALLGAWPLSGINEDFVERATNFTIKAAREGKEQTSWYAPNERYEDNLRRLVGRFLDQTRSADFATFVAFCHRCALLGALNSLTQLVLKMTMPGIPDCYQGSELWDLSFVDPDNRRPVDYDVRLSALRAAGDKPDWAALVRDWPSGQLKLALIRALLGLRFRCPGVFLRGGYRAIEVSGADKDEVIAYSRDDGESTIIVAAGRFFARTTNNGRAWPKAPAWKASLRLSGFRSLSDVLSNAPLRLNPGDELPVDHLFRTMPVAVLQGTRAYRDLGGPVECRSRASF